MLGSFSVLIAVLLASCGTPAPEVPTAPMDVAIDTGGQGMFYEGGTRIPRGFDSSTPFELAFELKPWGSAPLNDASAQALKAFAKGFPESGTYQPLGDGRGRITLAGGRLKLEGQISNEGKELAGDWSFDGLEGGSFRITEEGVIFPR